VLASVRFPATFWHPWEMKKTPIYNADNDGHAMAMIMSLLAYLGTALQPVELLYRGLQARG